MPGHLLFGTRNSYARLAESKKEKHSYLMVGLDTPEESALSRSGRGLGCMHTFPSVTS